MIFKKRRRPQKRFRREFALYSTVGIDNDIIILGAYPEPVSITKDPAGALPWPYRGKNFFFSMYFHYALAACCGTPEITLAVCEHLLEPDQTLIIEEIKPIKTI